MTLILDMINRWPRNNAGHPIMESTEEAFFYGTLIYDKPEHIDKIKELRKKTLDEVEYKRTWKSVNLQLLMDIAVKGQFYRECLEEVDRLKNEAFKLDQGGA